MTQTYYTLLTQGGAAELTNAQALGKHVPISHIAVGDGAGNAVQPTEAMKTLTREVYRAIISSVSVDEKNPNWLIIEAVIPADVGGWTVREIGLIGGTGTGNRLMAVGNFPASYKPQLSEGVARDMSIRMIIQLSNTSVVSLLVDPSVAVATAKTVENAIKGHQVDDHAHDQYVKLADMASHTHDIYLTHPEGEEMIDQAVTKLVNGAPNGMDTLGELALIVSDHNADVTAHGDYLPLSGGILAGPVVLPNTTIFSTGLKMKNARDIGEYFVPPGTIAFFAMVTLPTGWIKANGAQVSRNAYPELFDAIGTVFGVGNGSTTFNLPDLRGEFLRGWDDARGIDAGRPFGSAQSDAFKSHEHAARQTLGLSGSTGSSALVAYANIEVGSQLPAGAVSLTGGSETRPRNIAMIVGIKH